MAGQRKAKDLTGQRFGKLIVLWRGENIAEPSGAVRSAWVCRCDCGNGCTVPAHSLTRGRTKSCGCLLGRKQKHGKARSPVYRHWAAMIQRCTNPNHNAFHHYGGRGVTVCDRWRDFTAFLEDMGEPEPGMTLDRICNSKGYEPGNCRWASRRDQANNRKTNVSLTHAGQTLTLAEWGRVTGLGKDAMVRRHKAGWPVERILTEPLNETGLRSKKGA